MQYFLKRGLILVGGLILASCGKSEVQTIETTCKKSGEVEASFCACFAKSVGESLEAEDLEAYAEMMAAALKANDDGDMGDALGQAMAASLSDPLRAMRFGQASAKATEDCG